MERIAFYSYNIAGKTKYMENSEKEPVINYFPGHMNKALYKIKDTVHSCDAAIIVLDSRAPLASFPFGLEKIIGNKPKVIILNKKDMADPNKTSQFIKFFKEKGYLTFDTNLKNPKEAKIIKDNLANIRTSRDNKFLKLKLPLPPVKCLVLGIPNVGKSTIINVLGGRNRAATENVPGKTKNTTLFRASERLWLYDTPGILEPNVHDRDSMIKLALLGSVKDDILPHDYLGKKLLEMLEEKYPQAFKDRYGIDQADNPDQTLLDLAQKRGFLLSKGSYDTQRALHCILQEFKDGKIGGLTLDEPR